MDAELASAHQAVMNAVHPEDLFGTEDISLPPTMLLEFLAKKHDPLQKLVDPAAYTFPEDQEAAGEAKTVLSRLYEEAQVRINQHLYGLPGYGQPLPSFVTKSFYVGRRRYHIGRLVGQEGRYRTYEGYLELEGQLLGKVIIKVVTDTSSNHHAQRALRNLDRLHEHAAPQWKHLPLVLDRFHADARLGFVMRPITGFSLVEVRKHHRHERGVDQKHMVWMLDRSLSCLGYVHHCGVVHGNLSPSHIMVQPRSHNAIITGWSSGVYRPAESGERVEESSELFSAPEVLSGGHIGPWTDIFSLGKVIIWVLGGDPETDVLPDAVEPMLKEFILRLVQEDPARRSADAWALHEEQIRIKNALWARKYLHFEM